MPRSICKTPISFDPDLIIRLKKNFTEREIVILAATAAQVNYWTRLVQAFGIMPAGFTDNCPILKLDQYSRKKIRSVIQLYFIQIELLCFCINIDH